MANYSERECSSFADTCHCDKSTIDESRERLVVSRLNRCELEDRHLRLLEELTNVKKVANEQSDKIKRLATKLMRFGANPRTCVIDNQDRVALLESENCKLKEKVCALRNQLVNRKIFGRSPSRGRKLPLGSTSGPNTCRSENSRLKSTNSCQCLTDAFTNDDQNYAIKVQELEAEKKAMQVRIEDLEVELANYASGNRREKVAENVEYIRLWRQMKSQAEKLEVTLAANEKLNQQIGELSSELTNLHKSCALMKKTIETQREQLSELDTDLSKCKESRSDMRDKEERISDLSGELDIVKQHNQELLDLTSKYDRIEKENAELKRRIYEHTGSHMSLKDAFEQEKANNQALKAANEELLARNNELQKSVDALNIKAMGQIDKRQQLIRASTQTEHHGLSTATSRDSLQDCNCCGIPCRKKPPPRPMQDEKGIQVISEQSTTMSKSTQTENNVKTKDCISDNNKCKFQFPRGYTNSNNSCNSNNTLSRENMLRLLEQVQISSPMETQPSVTRIVRSNNNNNAVSNLEAVLFGDS